MKDQLQLGFDSGPTLPLEVVELGDVFQWQYYAVWGDQLPLFT